jgi:hypothetical protein
MGKPIMPKPKPDSHASAGASEVIQPRASAPEDSFDEKVKLAQITSQLTSKVEVRKAIVGALLGILTAVALSYLTTRSALRASRVVGGQYEVKLHEFGEDGQPRRQADGSVVGRSEAIIPIDFGGVFEKPPRVIVSINGIDSWGGANTRVHAYAGSNATKDRSDIVVKTWGTSIVFTVQVSWIAFEDVDADR